MSRLTTIELFREDLKFSAGHFTIFSATHREKLHGHNYGVHVSLTTSIETNGLRFDYRDYHKKIEKFCRDLNLCFLLPGRSDYLKIEEQGAYYHAHFNGEMIPFLKSDVVILPIVNTTVEDLSCWFIEQLIADKAALEKDGIVAITVKLSSNPGRSGSTSWSKTNER